MGSQYIYIYKQTNPGMGAWAKGLRTCLDSSLHWPEHAWPWTREPELFVGSFFLMLNINFKKIIETY
jgi:hypothetical protein